MSIALWWRRYQPKSVKNWILFIGVLLLPILLISILMGMEKPVFLVLPVLLLSFALMLAASVRNPVWLIVAIVVFNENILYFFDRSMLRYVYDLKQLLGIFLFLFTILFVRDVVEQRMLFKKQIVVLLVYQVIAILIATQNLDQPFAKSIYSTYMNLAFTGYFMVNVIVSGKREMLDAVLKAIVWIATVASFIYLVQYLVYDSFSFLYSDFRYRYGTVRFTEPSMLLALTVFLTFQKMLEAEKWKRFWLLISFALQMSFHLLISKGRMVMIGLVVAFFVLMLLQRRIHKSIVFFVFLFGTAFALLFFISSIETNQITEIHMATDEGIIATIQEVTNQSGNFGIRTEALDFYMSQMKGHWLLGQGLINQDNPLGYYLSGRHLSYYMVDVGLFGYLFQYGLVGLGIAIWLMLSGLRSAFRIYRRDSSRYWLIGYFVLMAFTSVTVLFLQEATAILYVGFAFALVDMEHREVMG